jgi:hypothetical protein
MFRDEYFIIKREGMTSVPSSGFSDAVPLNFGKAVRVEEESTK